MEKMENAKIRCWNKTHQKWNGDWRCEKHLTEWEMVSECCRMEPWTQLQIQDQHSSWRRWEDDINEFLKLEKIETENPTESNNQLKKIMDQCSTKTVEDGRHSKTMTQWLQKKDMKVMREPEEILKADQRVASMEWDWATTKWPTSRETSQREDQSQPKKWRFFCGRYQQLRKQHLARRKVVGTCKRSSEKIQNTLMDWWSRTSWWIE